MNNKEILLNVSNVSFSYKTNKKDYLALKDINLSIYKGVNLGIIGESGSGKSTLVNLISLLSQVKDGEIKYKDKVVNSKNILDRKTVLSSIQIVFQDAYSHLNPVMSVYNLLSEPLIVHKVNKSIHNDRILKILDILSLDTSLLFKFPHQLSGGQRQRVMIARALILNPEIILFDEPVASLDLSVKAKIMNFLLDIRSELDITSIFISHDLSFVKYMVDYVLILYNGRILEMGYVNDIFSNAMHPYTHMLLDSIPLIDPKKERERYKGYFLNLTNYNPDENREGCVFVDRCLIYKYLSKERRRRCEDDYPYLSNSSDHKYSCHYPDQYNEAFKKTKLER